MRLIFILFFTFCSLALACTGITIKTLDNKTIQARTIEYGESNLNSKLVISPREKEYQSLTPDGKFEGYKWKGKYGYVGASLITDMFIGEGINEAGLNAGLFYFPHYGSLAKFDKKNSKKSIVDMQLVSWILSNFSTVDEVKEGLKKIKIVNIGYDKDGNPLPTAHWRVADTKGGNIVIEIINNGEIKIHENKIGVLTNSPDYEWHMKNLNNYINLYAGNAKNFNINGQEFFSFGAGTGAIGLPGDITPPSRFVRAFYFLNTMKPANTSKEAINEAIHILNNFDLPIGVEYPAEHKTYIPKDLPSATQWTAISSLNDKEFYYKTMYNSQIRKIDLKKINFSKIDYTTIPLDEKPEENIKELIF
ncbi:Penicillin V acylase and related amidases [Fusobacterium necrogenes]|uniref:Penicillin V acylase and related amidases n=1 Tax=Fusobacterium necrogenes TaxID=858 RepID=A0A377GXT7_9FUSO|nr:choloylglycine hydrolase family protein [Fusobacterium necrogenes]STO31582.1 Penicillin V acylase and related amidases [Fusobacterium necrogenes]